MLQKKGETQQEMRKMFLDDKVREYFFSHFSLNFCLFYFSVKIRHFSLEGGHYSSGGEIISLNDHWKCKILFFRGGISLLQEGGGGGNSPGPPLNSTLVFFNPVLNIFLISFWQGRVNVARDPEYSFLDQTFMTVLLDSWKNIFFNVCILEYFII